ncbi:MAG: hypothetical protein ACPGF7_11865 [Pontibacterium sp.]
MSHSNPTPETRIPGAVTLSDTCLNIKADARRYHRWYKAPGFWVTFSYRVRRLRKHGNAYWKLLLPLDICAGLFRSLMSDTKIPADVPAGPGLCLPHPIGVIINDLVFIGDYVDIFQHVTVGEWGGKAPVLKNGAKLFAGARVFGDIIIGEHCKIGANTVVNIDVPDNHVAYMEGLTLKPKKETKSAQ